MPIRRRVQTLPTQRINIVAFQIGDGTAGFTNDIAMPDRETARREWPSYRRDTWAHTFRGQLPAAAEIFDGLTVRGAQLLWETWQDVEADLGAVLEAIDEDRNAVREFQRRDRGAKAIGDYLDLFLQNLDRVEAEARRIASTPGPYGRGAPQTSTGVRYGSTVTTTRSTRGQEAEHDDDHNGITH